jgi:tRNA-dihydrouridine synthase
MTKPNAEEWLGFLLQQGIAALTVHGRTVSQQSEGFADWGTVALAVRLRDQARLSTRIIGNGDVRTPQAFFQRAQESGADGVMIGRGIFENLFLFRAIREAAAGAAKPADFSHLSPREKVAFFHRHLALHRATWGEKGNFNVLKKFAKTYLRAFGGAHDLIDAVMHTHHYSDALEVLDAWVARRDEGAAEPRKESEPCRSERLSSTPE